MHTYVHTCIHVRPPTTALRRQAKPMTRHKKSAFIYTSVSSMLVDVFYICVGVWVCKSVHTLYVHS